MKKLLNFTIFIACLLAISISVSAQDSKEKSNGENKPNKETEIKAKLPSVNELFRKYVEAIGGRAAGEKVKSRVTNGTVELSGLGLKGTFEITQKGPDKLHNLINLSGFGMIFEGFDGAHAWSSNPIQGIREKVGEELRQAQMMADFNYSYKLEKLYPKAEVTGSEKIGEAETYIVKADPETVLYFDKKTGLMLRSDLIVSLPEGKVQTKTFIDEYREFEGIQQAFAFRQDVSGMVFLFKVSEIKQNVEVDDAKFSKPK